MAVRGGGRMLVLRPALISTKPLQQLIDEAQQEADDSKAVGKVALWLGGGLLAGSLVACACAALDDDGRRR